MTSSLFLKQGCGGDEEWGVVGREIIVGEKRKEDPYLLLLFLFCPLILSPAKPFVAFICG